MERGEKFSFSKSIVYQSFCIKKQMGYSKANFVILNFICDSTSKPYKPALEHI